MLNRRLIRIKVFKELFSFEYSGADSVDAAVRNLLASCAKSRELYYFLLNISGALVNVAREKIEVGMRKFHPTEEEANPNMKFVNNRFASIVGADPELGKICQKKALVWSEYDVFVKKIYQSMVSSDYYRDYMKSGKDSLEEDCTLFKHIFEAEFEDNQLLYTLLEDMSIYWSDDLNYVLNVIIRNIDLTKRTGRIQHVGDFQNEADKLYATRLLEETALNFEEYRKLIVDNVSNWDGERLVSTDIVLIAMGVTEAVEFTSIPVKVTINEYVEISKYYSTPNSRIFVNGMLDRLIQQKIESGEVRKSGRGLSEGNNE